MITFLFLHCIANLNEFMSIKIEFHTRSTHKVDTSCYFLWCSWHKRLKKIMLLYYYTIQ